MYNYQLGYGVASRNTELVDSFAHELRDAAKTFSEALLSGS